MMLLIDTQIALWVALDLPKLPAAARQRIANASVVHVSAVSLWEIGMKVSTGKLKLPAPMSDLEAKLVAANFVPLALTWAHAVRAYDLAAFHRDPFDRLLLAQAVTEPLHLLTTDESLKSYSSLVIAV
jgi:PIN domain nuclease of toxin-antitoxin system